jgi:hypothetical protein
LLFKDLQFEKTHVVSGFAKFVFLSSVEHLFSERGCCQHQALSAKKILSNTQTNNIQNSMIHKWIRLDYKLGTKEKKWGDKEGRQKRNIWN